MIQHSVSTMGANTAGGVSGLGGHQRGGASGSNGSQGVASGHPSPIHTYTSFERIPRPLYPQFYGGHTTGTTREDKRTIETGACIATRPICGVQERLFNIGARVPCRYAFARLLFDHVAEHAQGGIKGQCTDSEHGLH
jgi:hypothetical protein